MGVESGIIPLKNNLASPGRVEDEPPTAVSSLNICPEEACVHVNKTSWKSLKNRVLGERLQPQQSSVWFHLAVGQEQARLIYGDRHQKSSGLWGWLLTERGQEETCWGDENDLYLNQCGYTSECICHTHWTTHSISVHFTVCKFCLRIKKRKREMGWFVRHLILIRGIICFTYFAVAICT